MVGNQRQSALCAEATEFIREKKIPAEAEIVHPKKRPAREVNRLGQRPAHPHAHRARRHAHFGEIAEGGLSKKAHAHVREELPESPRPVQIPRPARDNRKGVETSGADDGRRGDLDQPADTTGPEVIMDNDKVLKFQGGR